MNELRWRRPPRSVLARLDAIAADLQDLTVDLQAQVDPVPQGRWAGSVVWQLLLVREMVLATGLADPTVAASLDRVTACCQSAVAAATPAVGELAEALADAATVLADLTEIQFQHCLN